MEMADYTLCLKLRKIHRKDGKKNEIYESPESKTDIDCFAFDVRSFFYDRNG